MNVDVGSWNGLHLSLRSISVEGINIDCCVFFGNLEMCDSSEHCRVVIVQFRGFVLQSNNFETLTANMASMNWSFSNEVKHLFVRMRIIFNTRSHANNNSPTRVRGENKNWVINCTKLGVDGGFHLVPLIHF